MLLLKCYKKHFNIDLPTRNQVFRDNYSWSFSVLPALVLLSSEQMIIWVVCSKTSSNFQSKTKYLIRWWQSIHAIPRQVCWGGTSCFIPTAAFMFYVLPHISAGLMLLPASVGILLLTHKLEFNSSRPSAAVGHGYFDWQWVLEWLELSGLVSEYVSVAILAQPPFKCPSCKVWNCK